MSSTLDAWNNLREKIRLIPISDIIGKHISLSKKGINFEGICPFHRDTHPSLKVNDQKNLFKCFACNVAGDSVKFVMDYKKLGFKEALESIAKDYGLSLPTTHKKINPRIQALLDCHSIVLQFYLDITSKNHQGELLNFAKDRKLTPDTLQRFKICYAPEGKHLAEYLYSMKANFNAPHYDTALELGLIKIGENGHYDTFRRRILFPILNSFGQIVAFGSRATYEGQMPKYLNSQDSLIFNKRNILYGLSLARTKIREHSSVFIVEGYMDAIMMHQAGFENTVAVMGVALTEDHLKDLSTGTKSYYLLLDQDQAGEIAAKRSLALFLKHHILPMKIDLLTSKDPDEFLKNFGQLQFQEQIKKSTSWVDYFLDLITKGATGENVDAKLQLLKEAFSLLKPLGKTLEATERLIGFAKKVGLNSPESSLVEQFEAFLKNEPRPSQWKQLGQEPETTKSLSSTTSLAVALAPEAPRDENPVESIGIDKTELYLVKHVLKNPELIKLENFTEVLEFVNNRQIKDFILFLPKMLAEVDFSDFAQTTMSLINERGYPEELKQVASDVFFNWNHALQLEDSVLKKQFLDLRKKLLIERLKRDKAELKHRHLNLKTQDELHELLKKVHEIDKKINDLKSSDSMSGIQKG